MVGDNNTFEVKCESTCICVQAFMHILAYTYCMNIYVLNMGSFDLVHTL